MATLRAAEAELLPAANSSENLNINDVAGNKTDTAVTTVGTTKSIQAYAKGILTQANLIKTEVDKIAPYAGAAIADLTTTIFSRDVVGNKADAAVTTVGTVASLIAYIKGLLNQAALILVDTHELIDHFHTEMKVYPTLAAGKTITGHATAWTLGVAAEIVPVNTITSIFDIHFVKIEAVSATDIYEVVLYSGAAADVEIGRFRTSKDAANTSFPPVAFCCPLQPANTKISAKCASSSGGGDTVTISIGYHTY
jgi:hypothetical protein